MLWAALYFPRLQLDLSSPDIPAGQRADTPPAGPLALVRQQQSRRLICSANTAALQAGIQAGMPLTAAYALIPALQILEYDPVRQQRDLRQQALWALRYSSWVSIHQSDILLLEIAASLKLFGGLKPLVTRLREDCRASGISMQLGIAPVSETACLFARMNNITGVLSLDKMRRVLNDIPIQALPLDPFVHKGLRQSGIRSCRQLFDLPRAALGRRFGTGCLQLTERLLGESSERLPAFEAPEQFDQQLDLPLETCDSNSLQFPLKRLLRALNGFLYSRALGVIRLQLSLLHQQAPATHLAFSFLSPVNDDAHLLKIITERLSRLVLTCPTVAIILTTRELAEQRAEIQDLFSGHTGTTGTHPLKTDVQAGTRSPAAQADVARLIERLAARLGEHQLYRPALGDDHRPEAASRTTACLQPLRSAGRNLRSRQATLPTHAPEQSLYRPARPIWLLPVPVKLPYHPTLISSAERIEYGWWDTGDVRRDYYIARDRHGVHYWVFCQRNSPQQFYLHGLFG